MKWNMLCSMVLILLFLSCCKEEAPCLCEGPEICIDNECVLPENTFKIGGSYITGENLYQGVNLDCFCIDSLLLDVKADGRFTIINKLGASIGAPVVERVSDTELVMISSDRLCTDFGGYHARINAVFHNDHIDTKLYFYQLNTPNQFRDSCEMTFYK